MGVLTAAEEYARERDTNTISDSFAGGKISRSRPSPNTSGQRAGLSFLPATSPRQTLFCRCCLAKPMTR